MARLRKDKTADGNIKLRQPDRSAPTEKTLLDIASERNLLDQVKRREKEIAREKDSEDASECDGEVPVLSERAERMLETALWAATISMLHCTFDVLVQNQYAAEINWPGVFARTGRALLVFIFLLYFMHPHDSSPVFIPGLPLQWQRPLRQIVFFMISVASGCYLIFISNTSGFLATMKQAPPLGCLWLWSVIELDLVWACVSLLIAIGFLKQGGYDIK